MNEKDLISLPVFTRSGCFLGQIISFEKDPQSGIIVKYLVRSKNPIKNIWQGTLQIDQSQIISIDQEKMVVEDSFKKIKEPVIRPETSI